MTSELNKSINVSVDDDTYAEIERVAKAEDRTIVAQTRRVLRQWAEAQGEDAQRPRLDLHQGSA